MKAKVKFVNLSNHPSNRWSEAQKEAALRLGDEIIDIPFPAINPYAKGHEIENLALDYAKRVEEIAGNDPCVVHVMGEQGFTTAFVFFCKYPCYHSTTERIAVEKGGIKTSVFQFVQFRQYFQP